MKTFDFISLKNFEPPILEKRKMKPVVEGGQHAQNRKQRDAREQKSAGARAR